MPTPPLDPKIRKKVEKLLSEGVTHRTIARTVGVYTGSVGNVHHSMEKPAPNPEKAVLVESDERTGDEREIKKFTSKKIKTLKELAEVCEIDTSEWEVYKWKCVAWQTGMKNKKTNTPFYSHQFSVSAWMRLKHNIIAAKNEIEELRKLAEKYSPKYIPFVHTWSRSKSGNMVEISIVDHH